MPFSADSTPGSGIISYWSTRRQNFCGPIHSSYVAAQDMFHAKECFPNSVSVRCAISLLCKQLIARLPIGPKPAQHFTRLSLHATFSVVRPLQSHDLFVKRPHAHSHHHKSAQKPPIIPRSKPLSHNVRNTLTLLLRPRTMRFWFIELVCSNRATTYRTTSVPSRTVLLEVAVSFVLQQPN